MFAKPNQSVFPVAWKKISLIPQGLTQKKYAQIETNTNLMQFINEFLDPHLPICVIGCQGIAGTGSSTLLNLIALHLDNTIPQNELFKTSQDTFQSTLGCAILNKKLVFNGVQIVLMDFEGLGGKMDHSRNMEESFYEWYIDKLICISFVIPSVLITLSHQQIISSDINKFKHLEGIHKRMNAQKIKLPDFKWFLRKGYQLNPQQFAKTESYLKANCPSILQNTNLVSISQLDQSTLNFARRQKFQEIEDLLLSATSNRQSLPKKQEFQRIFSDAFSLINSINFEVVYGQKLSYNSVCEKWKKTEKYKFVEAKKQLVLNCEKQDDNGELFEFGYKQMVNLITNDIQKRLKDESIPLETVGHYLQSQINTVFDVNKAKCEFLSLKIEKQAREEESYETEKIVKKFKADIQQNNNNNTNDLNRIIQEYKDSIVNQQQKMEERNRKKTKEHITNMGSRLFAEKILPLLINPIKLETN